ncbi:hypothetical protein Patl1_29028 [Pistacia atlantica]|uniref:Uncharacterized protein n=1 Tax=Pistacia atlantica TaxID=434234 RepID=A0ACC1BFH9_9ROSI|nr:hypothetical protein Patl1_29028 [Pistacia atlantica]
MESADLQLQHQLQLQQLNGYFSLLETKLASKVPRTQDWNSTTVLKDSSGDTDTTESISRSKECWSSPLFSNTIGQESFIPESANQLFPANNKVEMPDFFPKHFRQEQGAIILKPPQVQLHLTDSSAMYFQMPRLVNGVTRTKRPGSFTESKETRQDFRKSRSRSSCPPLKVRKEKLGDRIQALQKMVAPFGKTDTASVLTEAIGYIKFLHDRVQTLTTPYRNSSTTQACSSKEDKIEESKRNLRRRGLCLVPLPYASYFNSYDGSMETNNI